MSLACNSNWKFNSWAVLVFCMLNLVLAPLVVRAQAQGQGLEVRSIAPTLQEVAPGRILSLSFQVAQSTEREEVVLESLELPPNWQAVIPPAPFTLAPNGQTNRILAVLVPISASAGRYEIRYIARSQRDYALQAVVTIAVEVLPVRKLVFVVEDKPDFVVAGQPYRAQLRLLNQGNTPVDVTLRAESTRPGYRERVEPTTATLAARQSLPVAVTGMTNAKERRSFTHFVQVIARPAAADQPEVATTFGVEIIPVAIGEMTLAQELPTQLTLRMSGDERAGGVQAVWQGNGDLDDSGTRLVDFLFQGPNQQDTGIFGWRDEMRLNYRSPNLDMRLGDQAYSLSHLTDYFHYGRGAEADVRLADGYAMGAFTLRERWQSARETTNGFYLGRQTDIGKMKVNYLTRNAQGETDYLWSAEGVWPFLRRTEQRPYDAKLEMEYAGSATSSPGIANDQAYRAELSGRYGREVNYSFQTLHAGADYRGYYRDCDYQQGVLAFPIRGRLRGDLHYAIWRQNLERDPAKDTAPDERLAQANLRYDLPSGWSATLGYDDYRRRDLLQPAQGLIHERPFRLGLSHAGRVMSWNAEYRTGAYENIDLGIRNQVHDVRLYAAYRPSPQHFITLFGGYRSDGIGSAILGPSTHAGASITWQPTDALSLSGWYSSYDLNKPTRNHQGEISARYHLPGDRAWELRVLDLRPATGQDNTSYLLSYSLPISLPVGRKKRVGLISGYIVDPRRPGTPGVPGVILRLPGAAAITDKDGRFAFPTLPAGSYTLNVDQQSIGLNRITAQPMPMKLTVEGGNTTRVTIGIVPAATLSGRVWLQPADQQTMATDSAQPALIGGPEKQTADTEPRGLPDTLVEISNGAETLRRLTDRDGVFTFDHLRPGRWQIKVYDHNLPAYYRLETSEMEIVLGDAQAGTVTFDVLPIARRIQMLNTPVDVLVAEPVTGVL